MRYALALTLALLLSFSACSGGDDVIGPPGSGTLQVTTTTTGSDLDPDGYTFDIDGGPNNPIGPSATAWLNLPAGSHTIQLGGLAANCTASDNPRTLSISGGQTTTASFAITCSTTSAGPGTLQVFTVTTGLDPDPDGYSFAVDGGTAQPIGPNADVAIPNSAAGVHAVQLSGIEPNCALEGTNPRSVTLAGGATVEVHFAVACSSKSSPLVWRHLDTGTDYTLQDIWGSSASDLFTVGETSGGSPTSAILHFDGQRWNEQLTAPNQRLQGIWGSGPADVFAVGFNSIEAGPGGLIYHYDGSSWTQMDDPTVSEPIYSGVWGASGSDVWAVGEFFESRDMMLMSHFDGSTWTQDPFNSGGINTDVHGTSAHDVYMTVYSFLLPGTGVIHYDGSSWSSVVSFEGNGVLYGVWANSPSDVFAVGWDEDGGIIVHYDGRLWSRMELPSTPVQLLDVWGSSGSDVYAVGAGTILHYDGSRWTQVSQEGGVGVFALSASDVYVVGSNGVVLHGTP